MLRAINDLEYQREIGIEAYSEKVEEGKLLNIYDLVKSEYPGVGENILSLLIETLEPAINQLFMALLNNASSDKPQTWIDCSFLYYMLGDICASYRDEHGLNKSAGNLIFDELVKCTNIWVPKWLEGTGAEAKTQKLKILVHTDGFTKNYKEGRFDYALGL